MKRYALERELTFCVIGVFSIFSEFPCLDFGFIQEVLSL